MQRSVSGELRWTENRPSAGWLRPVDFPELWSYRELAYFLALRDLKLRYKQTVFGVAWAIIQPLAAMAVFSLVFGRLVGVPSNGVPYPVFVFAGLALWWYLANSVEAAAQSLVDHRELVTKVYFPKLVAPLAAVLPRLVDLAVSLVVVALIMGIYGVVPGAPVALLPAWVVAGVGLALATGLWLSALNVLYRDVRYALGFVLQIWFFASPVVFPSSLFDGAWRYLYAANPVVGLLEGFRWSLLSTPAPGHEAAVSLAVGVALLAGGVVYFRRAETRLADVI
jgi:lipopolysaccharide transport system permease protein